MDTYELKVERTANGYLLDFGVTNKKYFRTIDEVMEEIKQNIEELI